MFINVSTEHTHTHTHTHTYRIENLWVKFIWCLTEDSSPEIASQLALGNFFKEVRERLAYGWFWGSGYMQSWIHLSRRLLLVTNKRYPSFYHFSRYERIQEFMFIKFSENICLKVFPSSSPRGQNASFLFFALDSFQVMLKVSNCSGYWFSPHRTRW